MVALKPRGTVFKDSLFDAQWLRAASHASSGGAEIGECLAIGRQIRERDATSWFEAWSGLARRLWEQARASEAAGRFVSARAAYLRASNYFRASYCFLVGSPVDRRLVEAAREHRAAFAAAAALMNPPARPIAIPYGNATLHGYLFTPTEAQTRRPCLIITSGYDSSAEECYFFSGKAALDRGYTCLIFDGPGQGKALVEDGLTFRADWEAVIGPVVDYVLTRPEVDARRIALLGLSFGGYLAPRGASGEPRLAACVCDPGEYSLFEELLTRLPSVIGRGLENGNPFVLKLLDVSLRRRIRHLTAGWGIRRGLWTHGLATPLDYVHLTRAYSLEGRAEQIHCPTLVCSAENDEIGVTADRLFETLTCEKTRLRFLDREGAGEHCETGARGLFNERVFDWLDDVLSRTSGAIG